MALIDVVLDLQGSAVVYVTVEILTQGVAGPLPKGGAQAQSRKRRCQWAILSIWSTVPSESARNAVFLTDKSAMAGVEGIERRK